MRYALCFFMLVSIQFLYGQAGLGTFDGAVGSAGCKAVHMDSSIIKSWVSSCTLQRGYIDIASPSRGRVNYGDANDAIGKSNIAAASLGDGGSAVLSFDGRLFDGPGPDFAVFENSFSDEFLELAFVEVSSDGRKYVRFPAISETPVSQQIGSFDVLDASNLYNLAGKYRAQWGTPFDLSELKDSLGLDVDSIYFIRVVDVVGSINPLYARNDMKGRAINDPYPTDFEVNDIYSGGFDIEAVALINYDGIPFLSVEHEEKIQEKNLNIWPNPTQQFVNVETDAQSVQYEISDLNGKLLLSGVLDPSSKIDVMELPTGCFVLRIKCNGYDHRAKFFRE